VFVLVFVVLNLMLSRMIVQPISRMSAAADQSDGQLRHPGVRRAGQGRSRAFAGRSTDAPQPAEGAPDDRGLTDGAS
jgi:hypothetical protein